MSLLAELHQPAPDASRRLFEQGAEPVKVVLLGAQIRLGNRERPVFPLSGWAYLASSPIVSIGKEGHDYRRVGSIEHRESERRQQTTSLPVTGPKMAWRPAGRRIQRVISSRDSIAAMVLNGDSSA